MINYNNNSHILTSSLSRCVTKIGFKIRIFTTKRNDIYFKSVGKPIIPNLFITEQKNNSLSIIFNLSLVVMATIEQERRK